MLARIVQYILFTLIVVSAASAQFFYFGRNKVQYTTFDWHVLKTEHFDIYYYPEMKDLAERGAFLAEESYTVLEEKFVHTITTRIPLIFYSSHLHFQQTNTTPGMVPEGIGGFFEFMKGRVVIPYNGSMNDFKHVIRHELVHVFTLSKVANVLGGHRILLDRLPPLWFTEGLAEYWSTDWDRQAEMVMRDATVSGYVVPLTEMDAINGSFLMYKEGQNALKFIGERYGDEFILMMLENFWKTATFEDVFKMTLGVNYKEFSEEWLYGLKKQYFPLLSVSDEPSAVTTPLVTEGFNSKPIVYRSGNLRDVYFIGNRTGYASIYRINIDSAILHKELKPDRVIEGERTNELEAFHPFQSKLVMSKNGLLAFITKSGENDALHIYDTKTETIVKTYNFNDLVVLGSPSWSPDGEKIVLTGIDKSGSSDLYIWDTKNEHLSKLTNDIYDDQDPVWSPDGRYVVFASDRTPFGKQGIYNLFLYDFHTDEIRYLTCGKEHYSAPQFSADGHGLLFTCDIDGARNVWMMKLDSTMRGSEMRKITRFTTGAFDPSWSDSAMVFTAFEDFSFRIRLMKNIYAVYDTSSITRPISTMPEEAIWKPQSIAGVSEEKQLRYKGEYSMDVAQSQITTDPVFGTSGGAFLSLSDMLGNEEYNFLLYNTAQSTDELLSSFNVAVSRVSLQKRTNYAYGVYRFSGRRYDLTDPDEYFYERVFGGYFSLSYPLSKFQRFGITTSVSHSEKDITGAYIINPDADNIDNSRRTLFVSNAISFTHDNSLWGPTGPVDGSCFNITLAFTSDIQYSHANYYSVILDYRQYIRLALRTAYASRFWLFYNDGQEARRFFMGGSWDLRGYPRWSIRGSKMWLTSHELRYPFIDQLSIKFPVFGMTFIGIRGALFFDAGNAWDDTYERTLGSVGTGVRINLANVVVFRYDIGKRIENNFSTFQPRLFYQFFFGWDF